MNTDSLTCCVIRCGYTGRLVDKLGFKVKSKNVRKLILPEKNRKIISSWQNDFGIEQTKNFYDDLVFIRDKIYGDGSYYKSAKETKKILSILKKNDLDTNGIICFHCENFMEADMYMLMLKDVGFCSYGGIISLTILEKDDEKILYVRVDAESG